MAVEQAKEQYRKAYEEGDTDNVVAAQEALTKATAELTEADRYAQSMANQPATTTARNLATTATNATASTTTCTATCATSQAPDPETKEWAENNPWFMRDGYEEMTSLAYGKHATLVKQGSKTKLPRIF